MSTETRTEYSIQYSDGQNDPWGLTKYVGADIFYLPSELANLQAALRGTGATLLKRTLTASEPETVSEPLPTTPGSVVRATVDGSVSLFCHDDAGDGIPWRGMSGENRGEWYEGGDLSDVHVLFDAAEVGRE
jgi:hypothetical protein